jgi:hypothetical protein
MPFAVDKSKGDWKYPEFDTPIYSQPIEVPPRYTWDASPAISVENSVDKFRRFFPQEELAPLPRADPTSGRENGAASHIYGRGDSVHTIHIPYYEYESNILLN